MINTAVVQLALSQPLIVLKTELGSVSALNKSSLYVTCSAASMETHVSASASGVQQSLNGIILYTYLPHAAAGAHSRSASMGIIC
jgi:hypothetical protein